MGRCICTSQSHPTCNSLRILHHLHRIIIPCMNIIRFIWRWGGSINSNNKSNLCANPAQTKIGKLGNRENNKNKRREGSIRRRILILGFWGLPIPDLEASRVGRLTAEEESTDRQRRRRRRRGRFGGNFGGKGLVWFGLFIFIFWVGWFCHPISRAIGPKGIGFVRRRSRDHQRGKLTNLPFSF